MTEMTSYTPGTFCWVELSTSDAAAAKKFYTQLFGWTAVDMPAGPDMIYTMCQIDGKNVAALYQQGQEEQGIPPHWNSYISVASADEIAAKAKALGGTVMGEPFDVMDAGRMALVQDPEGVVVGAFNWNELATRDTAKAGEFYTKLFGWEAQTQDMGGGMLYTIFMNGGRMNGGMMQISEEWGDMPPHWAVYFAVADCDASAEEVKELGGQVLMPPTDVPQTGRFAMVQDPQGAAFAIIKLANPPG
jgi:predicted enzyme related to lactoylglutathione lyase